MTAHDDLWTEFAFPELAEQLGETVTINRGSDTAEDVKAFITSSIFEQLREDDVVHRWEARTFLLKSSDYDFGSGAVEPEEGDTITAPDGTYELMADEGEPLWSYDGTNEDLLRLHTKKVST